MCCVLDRRVEELIYIARLLICKSVFYVEECSISVPNTRKPSDLEVNKLNMHMAM